MKEIKAIIRREKAPMVLDNLEKAGVKHVTLTQILATGITCDDSNSMMSMEFGRNVTTMIKMKIICTDSDDLRYIKIIRDSAYTDSPGDGIIAVSNVNRLVKIRTSDEDVEAL